MYGINAENGLKMLGGNAAIYVKMLDKYLKGDYHQQFVDALNSGDMDATANAAHALKGVSANLCLDEVFELSRPLEQAAKDGALTADDPRIADLAQAYQKTIDSIQQVIANPALLTQ